MPAGRTVVANVDLGDASVSLLGPMPAREFHETYAGPRHLLAMYGMPMTGATGRYLDAGAPDFLPIGSIFCRPAHRRLECMGRTVGVSAVHCHIDEDRFSRAGFSPADWTERELASALDVRANHLFSYFARLVNELTNPGFASDAIIDALLAIIIVDLGRHLGSSPTTEPANGDLHDRTIAMLVQRICDVWEVTPRVGELARMAGMGERHLLRLFRERKGMSLADFIRETRLEKTRHLLSHTDVPLKQVAHRLGFSSQSSFAAAFKRETGSTPAGFRRENRQRHFMPR